LATKLEMAKSAIAELKKAVAEGEDVTQDTDSSRELEVIKAKQDGIKKSIDSLTSTLVKALEKAEDAPEDKKDDKDLPPFLEKKAVKKPLMKAGPEDEDDEDEDDEVKSSKILDLALEEIVTLRKQVADLSMKKARGVPVDLKRSEDKDEDDEEYPEDAGEEEVEKALLAKGKAIKMKKEGEPGPTAKLQKPTSTDYADSAESVQKAAFQAAVKKQAETILKQAGYVSSNTPITQVASDRQSSAAGGDDLTKSVETFIHLPWKTINKFRMQVDPQLRSLSQNTGLGGKV